jgi:hypothetical protein
MKETTNFQGMAIEESSWEMEIIVEEWSTPEDGDKEIFFRNMSGVLGEKNEGWLSPVFAVVNLMIIMRDHDGYPAVLGGNLMWLEWYLINFIFWIAGCVGAFLGMKGTYEEYTPVEFFSGGNKSKKLA